MPAVRTLRRRKHKEDASSSFNKLITNIHHFKLIALSSPLSSQQLLDFPCTMHLLSLLQLLLLAQAVTSHLISDFSARDTDMVTYLLYPMEPVDTTSVAKTEALLKTQYGDTVKSVRDEEMVDAWIVTSKCGYFETTTLMLSEVGCVIKITLEEQHEVLRRSRPSPREVSQAGRTEDEDPSAAPKATQEQEHPVVRQDVTAYIVFWKKESSLKDTQDFLKSKMGSGGDMYQIGPDDKIMGWGNVTLTPDAKTEVE
jgi:hypothetical protein